MAALQTGIILTTPIFFMVVLIVLWKLIRASDMQMSMLVYLKKQLDVMKKHLYGEDDSGPTEEPVDEKSHPTKTDFSRLAKMVDSEE